jgi:hypothetical protein
MPDYASILRRSVSALPDSTPEMREAVYQRARAALARQLTAVDPPLSTREIETQHQELEDAVSRLEAEFAPADEPAPVLSAPQPRDEFLYSAPQTPQASPKRATAAAAPEDIDEVATDFEAEDDADEYADDEEQSSRTPLMVGLVLVLLVLVGAGAFGFAQRGAILGLLGLDGEPDVAAVDAGAPPSQTVAAPDAAGTDKAPDRLTNNEDGASAPEPPAADAQPDAAPAEDAVVPGAGEEEIAALETPDTGLVGQRAIYYFQGAQGTPGQASEGTVTWTETTRDGRPAIQATLRIAEPDASAIVTIYKNDDGALPASHLVEIQFAGGLNTSPIQRVPALVLKQTEQARGQPLIGAAVPVTNELFWIALSDDDAQVAQNLQLLREGSWFDIPILFSDQTRALISFEKGIPGDKVFETVMSNWTAS